MTITCQPMDASGGAPTYSASNERQANAPLYGGGSGFSMRAVPGFRVGTGSGILTATSTTWTLGPCSAVITPNASSVQGSYRWASDQNVSGSVTAADATYARKDIVYIQVNDSSAGDGSGALTAPVLYLAGTPSATPVAPDLPARSFLVGTITVPVAGGGSPTAVLNTARFVAAGGIQPVADAAEQATLTAYEGLRVDRLDLDRVLRYNGSRWVGGRATVTLDALYLPLGAGYAAPQVTQNADGDVIFEGAWQRASGTLTMLANTQYALGTVPSGYRPMTNKMVIVPTSTAMGGWGRLYVNPAGAVTFETPTAFSGVAAASTFIICDGTSWPTT
ncbi:hypothetical protein [Paenarthrobacter ureafaciens]|uniref:hypothetical protein n=1 Tax=Paenarthrobacter ureafaciens TaxID=37931 RepID=UPI003464B1DB